MMKIDKKVERIFQIEIIETLSNIVEVLAENERGTLAALAAAIAEAVVS